MRFEKGLLAAVKHGVLIANSFLSQTLYFPRLFRNLMYLKTFSEEYKYFISYLRTFFYKYKSIVCFMTITASLLYIQNKQI